MVNACKKVIPTPQLIFGLFVQWIRAFLNLYIMLVQKCLNCFQENKNPKFCSKSCAAKFNNTNRKRTEESKEKVRQKMILFYNSEAGINLKKEHKEKSLKTRIKNNTCYKKILEKEKTCNYCKESFLAKRNNKDGWPTLCSNECYIKMKSYNAKGIKRQEYNGNTFDSGYEVKIAKWLDSNNIKWFKVYEPILWMDIKGKQHKYFPDFYLPDYNLYLDPKNPYCIKQQKEKLDCVSKMINLLYGEPQLIIDKINLHNQS